MTDHFLMMRFISGECKLAGISGLGCRSQRGWGERRWREKVGFVFLVDGRGFGVLGFGK